MAAEAARDPLHLGVRAHGHALGVEVVHVLGPVFDGRVAHVRMVAHKDLHGAGVQVGVVVLGGRAALDEVQVSVVLDHDERVLELAGALRVEAEVGLQRVGDLDTLGDVDKGSARPDRVVQRRELVVAGRDQMAEVLAHDGLVLRVERVLDRGVDDALLGHLILHVVIDDLGVVLGADAGQAVTLGLRDAQALEGVLDVVGHIVPVACLLGLGRNVGGYVVHVQAARVGAPVGGHGELVVDVEGLQALLEHPVGLVLLLRDGADDLGGQAVGIALVALLRLLEVVDGAVDVGHLGLGHAIHRPLRHRRAFPHSARSRSCRCRR